MQDLLVFVSRMVVFALLGALILGCALLAVNLLAAPPGRRLAALRTLLLEFFLSAVVALGLSPLLPGARKGSRASRARLRSSQSFRTVRAAKDYLASRIAAEAARRGSPLTEVERKMLYFSETAWTLPGIWAVNAEFERDYDEAAYEERIARLAAAIEQQDEQDPAEQNRWFQALRRLSYGDHYLSVLIDQADSLGNASDPIRSWLPVTDASQPTPCRPKGNTFHLIVFGVVLSGVMFILVYIWDSSGLHQAWQDFFR